MPCARHVSLHWPLLHAKESYGRSPSTLPAHVAQLLVQRSLLANLHHPPSQQERGRGSQHLNPLRVPNKPLYDALPAAASSSHSRRWYRYPRATNPRAPDPLLDAIPISTVAMRLCSWAQGLCQACALPSRPILFSRVETARTTRSHASCI